MEGGFCHVTHQILFSPSKPPEREILARNFDALKNPPSYKTKSELKKGINNKKTDLDPFDVVRHVFLTKLGNSGVNPIKLLLSVKRLN